MWQTRRVVAITAIILLLVGLLAQISQPSTTARAEGGTPVPSRKISVSQPVTWYDWWMVRWENNEVICRILIEHEGMPTSAEIQYACGTLLFNEWKATKPCDLVAAAQGLVCRGMYLHYVRTFLGKRMVNVELPAPKVWISIVGCDPAPTPNRCTSIPSLKLVGEEPLPNEMVIRIQGTLGGEPFSCPGDLCILPLRPTGSSGVWLEFWADSSYGDASERFKALIRVIAVGDVMAPDGPTSQKQEWYIDIISNQFREGSIASCSDAWNSLPEVGGPPHWLNTPLDVNDLQSTYSYYYLAGILIENGTVDASGCADGGLVSEKLANQCGMEKALPAVQEWQNRFDVEILKVAKDTGVPAQLLKNIFGRESQFWPGVYSDIEEAGLGQMTEKGADTLLLWNVNFYKQFCPQVLSAERCEKGFVFLKAEEQDMLRGALVTKVNAACPNCPVGIDLSQAETSVRIFGETLLASCLQTGRAVRNLTQRSPGEVASYVDLWKFTLANYNAGAGCLWTAMKRVTTAGLKLTWENVTDYLDPACESARQYVQSISEGQRITPTATSWVFQGTPLPPPVFPTAPAITLTPTPSLLANITATRTGTLSLTVVNTATRTRTITLTPGGPTRTATPTQEGYPVITGAPSPTDSNYP